MFAIWYVCPFVGFKINLCDCLLIGTWVAGILLCYGYFIRPMSHLCVTYIHRSHMNVLHEVHFLLWVLVSLIGKMSCCQIRDVGLIPTYTETNFCVGLMIKNIHHGVDTLGSNLIVFIEKMSNIFTWVHGFQNCHWILKQKKEFDSNSW